MATDLSCIDYLVIFSYGGLQAILRRKGKKLRVISNFTNHELAESMQVLASLLQRFQPTPGETKVGKEHVYCFGERYICIAKLRDMSKAESILGLLSRIVAELDKYETLPAGDIVSIVEGILGAGEERKEEKEEKREE